MSGRVINKYCRLPTIVRYPIGSESEELEVNISDGLVDLGA